MQLYEESLAARRQLEDTHAIASTLGNWGQLAREQGEYTQAVALLAEALQAAGAQQALSVSQVRAGE